MLPDRVSNPGPLTSIPGLATYWLLIVGHWPAVLAAGTRWKLFDFGVILF